ncbi:HvfA family oxazolone/thioamide-modified RiPP metallophore [Ferruginibacter albus]|uniref:HvfA family oxazolone/thioamide-modified RiPP metallophore n=1 Tax=Ferruginibacter albus TaxID=2875540 RepID=UPI001CC3574C|nr:hypothetical protein [Ferruginibacter albus]UAY53157.1 hypothetical protein K9M53_05650 [Ferruginibacter albus]
MNNNKNILKGSIIASALIAATGFTSNANGLFHYNNLGTGDAVRASLLKNSNTAKNFELKCGADSTSKAKDGKCGEGKCGEGKCGAKKGAKKAGKTKDAKCGEGKCGGTKKSS